MNPIKKSIPYGRHTLTLETGEIARQAGGAVLVSLDDTVVLVTAVARRDAKPGQDFFPLTVDYQEKTYAAGKIPGGFFKREGRPSEKETLTSRLIDRPIRPLFPGRLLQRGADHRDGHVGRSRDRSRHSGDDRRLGGAGALRRAVQRPDRRRARRLHRWPVRAQPDQDRAHDVAAEPRRRRHRSGGADGRIGSQRAARGSDAGRGGVRPPAAAGGDQHDRRARRRGRQAAVGLAAAREESGDDRSGHRRCRRPRCATPMACARSRRASSGLQEIARKVEAECIPADAGARLRQSGPQFHVRAGIEDRAQPDPVRRAAHRRPRHAHRAADHASAPACCRAPTARRSSRAAKRRRWWSPRSAPRATSSASTR